jgi:hypothetical protein
MAMKKALAVFATSIAVVTLTVVTAEAQRRGQPGQTGGGPTTGAEMMAPFNPQYYLGEWEIEWTPPDTELLPGGVYTGTETVTHINNRYLKIDVQLEGEDGNRLTGQGMLFFDWGLNGQSVVRYVVYDAGFSLFQFGPLGGDLGGYYSHFWETPTFEYNDHTFALEGRSYYVSPAAYRVNQQISIDGEEFFNYGIMWLTKEAAIPSGQ